MHNTWAEEHEHLGRGAQDVGQGREGAHLQVGAALVYTESLCRGQAGAQSTVPNSDSCKEDLTRARI